MRPASIYAGTLNTQDSRAMSVFGGPMRHPSQRVQRSIHIANPSEEDYDFGSYERGLRQIQYGVRVMDVAPDTVFDLTDHFLKRLDRKEFTFFPPPRNTAEGFPEYFYFEKADIKRMNRFVYVCGEPPILGGNGGVRVYTLVRTKEDVDAVKSKIQPTNLCRQNMESSIKFFAGRDHAHEYPPKLVLKLFTYTDSHAQAQLAANHVRAARANLEAARGEDAIKTAQTRLDELNEIFERLNAEKTTLREASENYKAEKAKLDGVRALKWKKASFLVAATTVKDFVLMSHADQSVENFVCGGGGSTPELGYNIIAKVLEFASEVKRVSKGKLIYTDIKTPNFGISGKIENGDITLNILDFGSFYDEEDKEAVATYLPMHVEIGKLGEDDDENKVHAYMENISAWGIFVVACDLLVPNTNGMSYMKPEHLKTYNEIGLNLDRLLGVNILDGDSELTPVPSDILGEVYKIFTDNKKSERSEEVNRYVTSKYGDGHMTEKEKLEGHCVRHCFRAYQIMFAEILKQRGGEGAWISPFFDHLHLTAALETEAKFIQWQNELTYAKLTAAVQHAVGHVKNMDGFKKALAGGGRTRGATSHKHTTGGSLNRTFTVSANTATVARTTAHEDLECASAWQELCANAPEDAFRLCALLDDASHAEALPAAEADFGIAWAARGVLNTHECKLFERNAECALRGTLMNLANSTYNPTTQPSLFSMWATPGADRCLAAVRSVLCGLPVAGKFDARFDAGEEIAPSFGYIVDVSYFADADPTRATGAADGAAAEAAATAAPAALYGSTFTDAKESLHQENHGEAMSMIMNEPEEVDELSDAKTIRVIDGGSESFLPIDYRWVAGTQFIKNCAESMELSSKLNDRSKFECTVMFLNGSVFKMNAKHALMLVLNAGTMLGPCLSAYPNCITLFNNRIPYDLDFNVGLYSVKGYHDNSIVDESARITADYVISQADATEYTTLLTDLLRYEHTRSEAKRNKRDDLVNQSRTGVENTLRQTLVDRYANLTALKRSYWFKLVKPTGDGVRPLVYVPSVLHPSICIGMSTRLGEVYTAHARSDPRMRVNALRAMVQNFTTQNNKFYTSDEPRPTGTDGIPLFSLLALIQHEPEDEGADGPPGGSNGSSGSGLGGPAGSSHDSTHTAPGGGSHASTHPAPGASHAHPGPGASHPTPGGTHAPPEDDGDLDIDEVADGLAEEADEQYLDPDNIRAGELLADENDFGLPMPGSGSQGGPIDANMFDDSPVKPLPPNPRFNKKTRFEG